MANVFYIVMGKDEKGLYDVVSSRFERAKVDEAKLTALYELGCVSAGARVEGGKVVLPVMSLDDIAEPEPETAKADGEGKGHEAPKPEPEKKPETVKTEKPEAVKVEEKKHEAPKPKPEKKAEKPAAVSEPAKKELPAAVKK